MFTSAQAIGDPSGICMREERLERQRARWRMLAVRGRKPGASPRATGSTSSYDPTQISQSFADLPHYRFILKHKEIGKLFDIAGSLLPMP